MQRPILGAGPIQRVGNVDTRRGPFDMADAAIDPTHKRVINLAAAATAADPLTPQDADFAPDVHEQLAKFRGDFPFVPITQWPSIRKLFAVGNAVAVEIAVPAGALAVRFGLAGGNFMFTSGGNAAPPVLGQPPVDGVLNPPPGIWYYCGSVQSFSVICDGAGGKVSAEFVIQR